MKRLLILVVIAMLAGLLFAEEGVLIDFSLLVADVIPVENPQPNRPEFQQNRHTMMDFSRNAGGSIRREERDLMKTSLAIENWSVDLSSSSRSVETVGLSYTREAPSEQYGKVMGVRVRFPTEPFNAWAIIRPPFEIPAFDMQTVSEDWTIDPQGGVGNKLTRFERQDEENKLDPAYGVIKNVGVVKSVAVSVYGLNFPHGLSTILIDSQGNQRTVFMGFMEFDGWRELIWNNPQYVNEVRNRDIRLYPLYPTSTPFVKFGGFLIQRDAAKTGGDFIAYFKDVKVIYDLAVLDTPRDIDDEGIWHIIQDREDARKTWEMERFGQEQILRYIEQQKQATEFPFDHESRVSTDP